MIYLLSYHFVQGNANVVVYVSQYKKPYIRPLEELVRVTVTQNAREHATYAKALNSNLKREMQVALF